MFRNILDQEAEATVDAAWQQGTRYFDTATFYAAGLSEIRLARPWPNTSATNTGSVPRWAGSYWTKLTRKPGISVGRATFSNSAGLTRSFMTTQKRAR